MGPNPAGSGEGEQSAAPTYAIVPLGTEHERGAFRCGSEQLDRYLHQLAGQWGRRGLARTYVLVGSDAPERVLGYYTLSATKIVVDQLPQGLAKGLPHGVELGAILLGRLAVDQSRTGQGLGRDLLFDALDRSVAARVQIGAWAVVVDAIDASAVAFYERFDFVRFPETPNRLFLPLDRWARLRATSGQ